MPIRFVAALLVLSLGGAGSLAALVLSQSRRKQRPRFW